MSQIPALEPRVADVYITSELDRRVRKTVDPLQEKRAILELAARMADRPDEILPRFVDLAMEMTGGVSAGLSLYELDPWPGVFRWRYLRGTLSPFDGATTPRNFSPCGVTLDQNGPVLSLHPERVYDWISDADMVVPEVLLVPLYIGSEEPLGTLWIVSDVEGHFDRGHADAMTDLASVVGIAVHMQRAQEKLHRALEEQETLTQEMSHRVKNLFAVTDGMIRMTARKASSKDEMAEMLSGRLHALANAHALVSRNLREIGHAPSASNMGAVIEAVVLPHQPQAGHSEPRVVIHGPTVRCGDHALNGMALVFHELATNAAKYGALAVETGSVRVEWRKEGEGLLLVWSEAGGPPIARAPEANGFGSTLVRKTVIGQLGGTLDYDWKPDGLTVTMGIPLARLAT
ncbi:MAG TPA: HWE histidine kinase domain-containing protein [Caulobacteraceae bacterium]|jgi:two-component sensor histidine kinase|nr:HWE histidine kinase domain-containing protein [Caulobacteraceae bacterium]